MNTDVTPLVTMTVVVHRDGQIDSDIQTHDNSYSEVALGLAAVREEIHRVFAERKHCPHYPPTVRKKRVKRSSGS